MRLSKHREDIKWLTGWITDDCDCDTCNMFRGVKKRYQNLIRCFEQQYNRSGMITPADVEEYGGPWLKHVLKDAEK